MFAPARHDGIGHRLTSPHAELKQCQSLTEATAASWTGRTLTLSAGGADAIASRPPKLRWQPASAGRQ